MTVNDIVSSIFKKNKNQWLSPVEIRDTSNYLSDKLGIQRPGDPGRTARMFAQQGYIQKDDAGNCLYDPANLSPEQVAVFSNYEYVYDKISEEDDNFMLEIPIPSNQKLTEDDLGKILADFREKYGTYGVHYFAVKYARIIQENQINKRNLVEKSHIDGNPQNWGGELLKGIGIYDLAVQDGYLKLFNRKFVNTDSQSDNVQLSGSYFAKQFSPSQIIYYGVPGSGKSHKIDEETKSIPDTQKMRIVFHPDYSNADFVGQILPAMLDEGVEYRFKAGPFSRILKRALKNPSEPHYLIIEEINRGNAAAIFGDLFQLLDRNERGWSNYQIENLDLNAFIRSSDNTYSDKKITTPTVKVGNDNWDENTGIRLPPNLSILATMNTSDQNVFTLDNAFQRRWDMQLVENNFGDTNEEKIQREAKIGDSQITWETFQTAINAKIGATSSEMGLSSLEDKRLGCWFVKNENGKIPKEVFANKVLKYLWDDAFKFSRDKIFEKCSNFEELKSTFEQKGFEIFKQDLQNEFHKNKDSETSSE